jgi:hypothetical protein
MTEVDPIAEILFKRLGGCHLLAQPRNDVAIGDTFICHEGGVYEQRHISQLAQGVFEVPPHDSQPAAPIEIEAITQRHISASLTFWQSILAALNLTDNLQANFSLNGAKTIKIRIELTGVTRETTVNHAFEAAVEHAKFDLNNRVVSALVNDGKDDETKKGKNASTYRPRLLIVCGLLRATGILLSAEEVTQRKIGGKAKAFSAVEGGGDRANKDALRRKINFKNAHPLVFGVYLWEMNLPAKSSHDPAKSTDDEDNEDNETNLVLRPTSAPLPPLQVLDRGTLDDLGKVRIFGQAEIIQRFDPTKGGLMGGGGGGLGGLGSG